MNAYEKENRIKYAPKDQLIAVMQGQSDAYPQWMALAELNARREQGVALTGEKAKQQLAQGKQTVKDRRLSEMLPELLGIGQLPAPNMEALAAADGGIVGYAGGGEVERYQGGGWLQSFPAGRWASNYWEELQADKQKREEEALRGLGLMKQASPIGAFVPQTDEEREAAKKELAGIKTPVPVAPKAPAAAPAAPSAANANVSASPKVGKAVVAAENLSKPVAPVENPTEAEKSRIDQYIDDMKKLQTALRGDKADEFAPIKEQLAADRKNLETMKSENVGLALLGAAGAMLKPGRSTASAIGEGLSSLAESGTKFQPQLAAVRQGLMGSDLQLAQAQAAADKGDMATAAALIGQARQADLAEKELGIKAPLFAAQARYYGARAADTGGAGGSNLAGLKATQSVLQARLKALQGKVDPDSQAQARQLQLQLKQLGVIMAQRTGINLTDGFVGGKDVTGKTYRSSLFEE